jgi:hypothetical protein
MIKGFITANLLKIQSVLLIIAICVAGYFFVRNGQIAAQNVKLTDAYEIALETIKVQKAIIAEQNRMVNRWQVEAKETEKQLEAAVVEGAKQSKRAAQLVASTRSSELSAKCDVAVQETAKSVRENIAALGGF